MKARVDAALTWLRKHSNKSVRDGMSRCAIPNEHALGVRMNDIQKLGRQLGRDHALALALWKTGVYEARMLSAHVDEPACVTAAQMDAQARQLAAADAPAPRWVGKDALRQLASAATLRRVKRRSGADA